MESNPRIRGINFVQRSNIFLENPSLNLEIHTTQRSILIPPLQDHVLNVPDNHNHVAQGPPLNSFMHTILSVGISFSASQTLAAQSSKAEREGFINPITSPPNIIPDASDSRKEYWTPDKDKKLVELVKQHGLSWSQIAISMKGKLGKQCRDRWLNHLRPDIKKDTWTIEEDMILITAHQQFGNKWAKIAKRLPGRSENSIKNHWNSSKRRRRFNMSNDKANDGLLLYAYIQEVTKAEMVEHELRKKVFYMKMHEYGEGTSTRNAVYGGNIERGPMVENVKKEIDFMNLHSNK